MQASAQIGADFLAQQRKRVLCFSSVLGAAKDGKINLGVRQIFGQAHRRNGYKAAKIAVGGHFGNESVNLF